VPALFIAAAVAAAVALFGIFRFSRKTDEAWKRAADTLGLDFTPGNWKQARTMMGAIGDHGTTVSAHRSRSSSTSNSFTRYQVRFAGARLGLRLSRQTSLNRFGRIFGMQDIEVGDPLFDEAVVVKGNYDAAVSTYLTPARRMAAHRLITEYRGLVIEDGLIRWEKRGIETDPDKITTNARRLVEAARVLSARRSTPAADEALRRQQLGDVGEAVREWRRARADDTGLETERLAGEAMYAGGHYDEAATALRGVSQALPADPWADRWTRQARRRAIPTPPPPGASRGRSPTPSATAPDTDVAAAAQALFDKRRLSYESARLFESEFEGRRVRWSGELQRHRAYSTDLDFEGGPGVKAVFEVHRLRNDLFGGRNVDAVVQLPPEAADLLDAGRGETFTFEGTLLRVDALMRNLFVSDGRLIAGEDRR